MSAMKGAEQQGRATSAAPAAPVQMKANGPAVSGDSYAVQRKSVTPDAGEQHYDRQREAVRPGGSPMQEAAKSGVAGAGAPLPFADQIGASFGPGHDLSGVRAHVGGRAKDAGQTLGAKAYATGSDVAFNEAPDLHTAAHEAAHIVQQRNGVQLSGGVGQAGDSYEQNADAVADRVVAGQSAADLLPSASAGAGAAAGAPVQLLGDRLDQEAKPENKPNDKVAYHHRNETTGGWDRHDYDGETREYVYGSGYQTTQRKYEFGQYQAMWEKEQGRPMTESELATLRRGCIGITVLNTGADGNPPLGEAYATFEQGHARMADIQKLVNEHPDMTAQNLKEAGIPLGLSFPGTLGQYKAVMFAKLFWSNQKAGPDQAHFNAGKHDWDEEHVWEKKPVVLPNGLTIEQHMQQHGRSHLMRYIREEVGEAEFQKLMEANHQENVKAYYMAWAKAVEKSDPEAFPIDEATGKVDMTRYTYYHGRPKIKKDSEGNDEYKGTYVNFDYGFWDEDSQSFWHANHMQYDQARYGEQAEKQPMLVYQSTKEKFAKGYFDFDRIVYGIALTKNWNPNAAARNNAQP
ncbi:MAG: hypothetical protein RIT45_4410 [Pseudomonadota bacterium]|jgi:hypothetical protein